MSMQPYNNPPVVATRGAFDPAPAPSNDLMTWALEAGEVHKIAQALATTTFVPAALTGKPDDIAAMILFGRDVGMSPMVSLQQIHIIDRKPSLSALAMRGLAQANGVKFRIDEATEARCVMAALAPGDAGWTTVTWTIDRAKKLGLTTKPNWTKQPQAMLIARATSELCRLVAAPLFLGLAYSVEELRDGVDDYTPAPNVGEDPPPPAKRTLKRKPVDEPVETPPPDAPVDKGPPSDNILRALMAAFRTADITDRDDRLGFVSGVLGRPVTSVNDIDDTEGKQVLDRLRATFAQAAGDE